MPNKSPQEDKSSERAKQHVILLEIVCMVILKPDFVLLPWTVLKITMETQIQHFARLHAPTPTTMETIQPNYAKPTAQLDGNIKK